MAKLYKAECSALSKTEFGFPEQRKYPMPDKAHAGNAKARASQMEARGVITPAQKSEIDRKANKVLGSTGHWSGH